LSDAAARIRVRTGHQEGALALAGDLGALALDEDGEG
jgi:hypothetical protein